MPSPIRGPARLWPALLAAALAACAGRSEPEARTPWEQARERGATFRALGNEPGWSLEIADRLWMHLSLDYGKRAVYTHAPAPEPGEAGGVVYHARTRGHDLRVAIREERCRDTLSGESFPLAVAVTVDGRELAGCGRWLR